MVVAHSVRAFVSNAKGRVFESKPRRLAGEGLKILTYARHLYPLSSESSLACHTCDMGHPFIMVISKPVTLTPNAERLAVELSLPV